MEKNKLIFDLDSTLIHCIILDDAKIVSEIEKLKKDKRYRNIENNIVFHELVDVKDNSQKGKGVILKVAVFLRPHLREFIDYVSQNFEIDIWSAGELRYVRMINYILSTLNINFRVHKVLSRRDCKITKSKVSKNISSRNYNSTRTIIIDDRPDVCSENSNNSIQIPKFETKANIRDIFEKFENDNSLITLMEWMKTINLKDCEDVQNINKEQIFN